MRSDLPSGTVTFLFTDVESSTQQVQRLGESYPSILATQRKILRAAFQKFHGHEVDTQGDSFFVAFARAGDAVAASVQAQRALAEHAWPAGESVRVRMGLHTGAPPLTAEGYVGLDVHIASRLCAAAHGGQVLLSQATGDLVEQRLPDDVSVRDLGEHRLKDLDQPRRIFQLVIAELPDAFPPLRSLDALPHNLPIQLTSFVGRTRELAETKRLFASTRLLTLTGAGGAGKTRLALQIGADLAESYPNGVWFVELAPLADSTLVPQAVATTLGVREQSGQSLLASLQAHLRSKTLLLILDNCEHLIDACARLADSLLRACPNLSILATSREALGIAGETTWSVPSLSLPEEREQRLTFSELSQYEAVQLFVDRALAVQPSFKLTDLNAAAIVQICRRLDGIPLAIELAAARVQVLKTAEIAARLDDRFTLLTGGSRTALPRQQTLRGTIDWSYDLLSELECVLLRRLSVFAGGCTLQAAEQVAGEPVAGSKENLNPTSYYRLPAASILDLLSHLVSKSLVSVNKKNGETRYEMLETIRQYAREKLQESGEAELMQDRHLAFFVQLALTAEPHLIATNQVASMNRLELEHDNLRAALDWSRASPGKALPGLQLASALLFFWETRGYIREGQKYLIAALEHDSLEPSEPRAKALYGIGNFSMMQGDYGAARTFFEASLAVYRELGPASRRGFADTVMLRGYMETEVGDYATAAALIRQGLGIMRELDDQHGIGRALHELGTCALRAGDYVQAARYLQEALPLMQATGDRNNTAITLTGLAEIALRQADYARATELEQKSLALRREISDKWGIAVSLGNLAWIALRQGDLAQAATLLSQSAALRGEIGERGGIAWCLEKFAELALLQAQSESPGQCVEHSRRAARLFGAAAALRASIHSVIDLIDQPKYEHQLEILREQLGATFDSAWAEGQAMTQEQAIEYARAVTAPQSQVVETQTESQTTNNQFVGLTGRERQVASLIAQGESNREIAEELVVSERTVETHVANILNKLGFTSRAQVRKWARVNGLTQQSE